MTKAIWAVLLGCSVSTAALSLEIVKDGVPEAEIVIAEEAHEGTHRAAEDLRDFLRRISGAELRIVHAPSTEKKNHLYVGRSVWTDKLSYRLPVFRNSGYDILVKGNYAVLAGPMVTSLENPYRMSSSDAGYLRTPLLNKTPKPANFPSPGLKKWQSFTGRTFSTLQVGNGGGVRNAPLKIFTNDDLGDWYAVSAFLEELGVRFYAPCHDGTIVPRSRNISVEECRITKEAAFARREWTYYGAMRSDRDGIAWLKRMKCGNHTLIIYNHTTYAVYSTKEQLAKHPEYFAEEKPGKKWSGFPAGSGIPRYTDPGFRRDCVLFLRKMFDAFPHLAACAMGPPDGSVRLDYRDMEQYRRGGLSPEQAASNYVWDFHVHLAKELAKTHPGKKLLYMSGAGAKRFPTNFKSGEVDNIIIPFTQPYSAYRVLQSTNDAVIRERKEWLEKVNGKNKCPVWDYYLYYRIPSMPRYPVIFTRSLQREMREMLPYADGKFIEVAPEWMTDGKNMQSGSRIGTIPLIHLMMYIQNKLFWEPDLDMRALLEEFYRLYYGPAAQEMKAYYEFAEEVWTRQEGRSVTLTTGFLKEKDVPVYFQLLAEAKKKVPANSVYFRRIDSIEKGIEPLKKLFPSLKRVGPDIRACRIADDAELDGDLSKYRYGWLTMKDNMTGEEIYRNRTRAVVALSENRKFLRVGVVCNETDMSRIKAACISGDDSKIFEDDVVEVYLNTPEHSDFKIVVNSNGVIYDESTDAAIVDRDTLPILWNPGVKAVVRKYPDRWEVEIEIPTADFGTLGPTKQYPWGIQIGRTRMPGGGKAYSIAPTGGAYRIQPKWGNLWVR